MFVPSRVLPHTFFGSWPDVLDSKLIMANMLGFVNETVSFSEHPTGARCDDILSVAQNMLGGLADREEFRELVLGASAAHP